MNKKMKKNNKLVNATHSGYVLYDADLKEDYFSASINKVISLHDVFTVGMKEDFKYEFKSVHSLDEVSFKQEIDGLMKNESLKNPAEFTFIYFNSNLRGYYYRFNQLLFDERSVKLMILGIEKQYFNGKFNQASTSYLNATKVPKLNFKGQFEAKYKQLTCDEALTKRIKQYCKNESISTYQFFVGVLGLYYKVGRNKDLAFKTNITNKTLSIVGAIPAEGLCFKRIKEGTITEYLKSDLQQKKIKSSIAINVADKMLETKGSVTAVQSKDILDEFQFNIVENDWDMVLEIAYQKYKIKKDDVFLMINKLRMVIYSVLESKELPLSDLDLLTKKEKENALLYSDINMNSSLKSISESFIAYRLAHPKQVAVEENQKTITYEDLDKIVKKLTKALKDIEKGDAVSIETTSKMEQLALVIALDQIKGVYTRNSDAKITLKKGLFGYKASANSQLSGKHLQYILNGNKVSRQGYNNYCHWIKKYLKMSSDERVLVEDDLLTLAIPALMSGCTVVCSSEDKIVEKDITIAVIEEANDYNTLKHGLLKQKSSNKVSYKLHLITSFEAGVPISFIAPINYGKVQNLNICDGLGCVLLNKNGRFTQAFEKGKLHLFGPASLINQETININNETYHNVVDTNQLGMLFLDGVLRL